MRYPSRPSTPSKSHLLGCSQVGYAYSQPRPMDSIKLPSLFLNLLDEMVIFVNRQEKLRDMRCLEDFFITNVYLAWVSHAGS
jgi:hypothetical protein